MKPRSAIGLGVLVLSSCSVTVSRPGGVDLEPLDTLADSDQAVARIYGAPIAGLEWLAVHTWVVVKPSEANTFERWEVLPAANGDFGHVWRDAQNPEDDFGAGGVFVVAEIVGVGAEPIVDFVRRASPGYPCRDAYIVYPGPDSNTYTQWVVNKTNWFVFLPYNALGKDAVAVCP